MMSSNGNFFCITGPLWGESTGHWWIPLTNASDTKIWCLFSLMRTWRNCSINGSANNGDDGDLREIHWWLVDSPQLWPRDAIWWLSFGSAVAQEVAWCLKASSHRINVDLSSNMFCGIHPRDYTSKITTISPAANELPHWGLLMWYGNIDLGQHWIR